MIDSGRKTATLSSDGRYRFVLMRWWYSMLSLQDGIDGRGRRRAVFIMLNPSTADAMVDDATIRRCVTFSQRWMMDGLEVVNLFAMRSTDPRELGRTYERTSSPASVIGAHNDEFILEAMRSAWKCVGSSVICAWGPNGRLLDRDRKVALLADMVGIPLWCLGTTKDGDPKHPLRLRADTPLQRFTVRGPTA